VYVAFAYWHTPRIRKKKLTTPSPYITALAVACRDIDVRNVKALIMGPHETPYEFGFFEVCHERRMYSDF
jgi:ubiquitin-protein ligase